jgi:hypothetical protein
MTGEASLFLVRNTDDPAGPTSYFPAGRSKAAADRMPA